MQHRNINFFKLMSSLIIYSLAARAEETKTPNGAVLQQLPFSKGIFTQIAKSFPLHGETTIVLNRSTHATFIDIDLRETEWNAICKLRHSISTSWTEY